MPIIIIFPRCLITNWQSVISKHAKANALQANTYHGPTPHSFSEANILKCDIVITSYNTFTQEFIQTETSTSCIFKINWHCIILDEELYICSQYIAPHHAINSLLLSCEKCLTGTPIHNIIHDRLGIISFITHSQSSAQDNWSPFILNGLSKGSNDIFQFSLHHTKTSNLQSLPIISHKYELLQLNPTMQKEYSALCKEFLSSKKKGPGEFFRSINKLQIVTWWNVIYNLPVSIGLSTGLIVFSAGVPFSEVWQTAL
ncbi:hypothetical protein O181_051643 [Austropuccinia psidii MF-1]|uniref:SNF2 N-terminal domain-containing protein n=1 Tax=Austropuccinia psidii MF-1 TaxID=1389203 RepID=A0A9Q3HNK3_9BASI|nr:hypothetical protein [Austropuccinia psidii MF-1]